MSDKKVEEKPRTVCGCECERYSRVCGYFRPVKNWNKGKQQEFKERLKFDVTKTESN